MISDLGLAIACSDTYTLPPTLVIPVTGTVIRITDGGGAMVVAPRGSVTPKDWVRDFIFQPVECLDHPQLGFCHAGFLDAARKALGPVLEAIGDKPAIIAGHSLGGAIGLGIAGLMKVLGRPPLEVITFGAPRFGMATFVSWMADIPVRQYRRGNDIVPTVPYDVPPYRFADTRYPLISIGRPRVDFLNCHHIDGYVEDIKAREAA